MHLSQDEVQALLGVGLVVEHELTPHVVQLEELDADGVAVSD